MRGTEFLPVSREEMLRRDWYYYDFLVVTADAYIEKTTYELRKEERVRVVTSDNAEQLIILGHGALRVSAGAFHQEVESAEGQIADILRRNNQSPKPRTLQAALEKAKKTDPCPVPKAPFPQESSRP